MKRFLCNILLGSAVLSVTAVWSSAENLNDYRFHSLPETSYYGGVHSIAKDSIGRIWFSGSDAVYMYDGLAFNRFNDRIVSEAPDSRWTFLQVITAADKSVYVGTNRGLMRLDYATMHFSRVIDGNISFLTVDDSGRIWMIRNDVVEAFDPVDGTRSRRYPFPENVSVNPLVLSLACTGGNIYVSLGGEVYLLDAFNGNYEKFARVDVKDCVVRDVEEYDGVTYVLTAKNGIYGFSLGGRPISHYRLPKEYAKSTVAKELYLAQGGTLWAATQSGLFLVDTSNGRTQMLRTNIHYPYSLPNNSVWTIYPDPDGGLWVGTYGGKLAFMPVSDGGGDWFKATPGGLSHSIVSCFEEDSKGNIWIGTEGGGVNYWDRINNCFIYYTQENNSGVRSNMIKKLCYDGDNLMMSSFNGGMQILDRDANRFVDFAAGIEYPAFMSVYDFVKDGVDGYWISDPDSPLKYLNLRRRTVQTRLAHLDGQPLKLRVENMFRSQSGDLSLVTSQGLYVLDKEGAVKTHYYLPESPFAKNDLCCYCISADGQVWLGTRGGGLNVLTTGGEYVSFRDANGSGLDGKTIFGILDDAVTGDLWMSTDDGLYVYDKSDDVFRKSTIDATNLCGAYYVRSCFKTSDGEMLFGGTDGFIMFDPRKIGSNTQKPKPFFVSLKINSETVDPMSEKSPLHSDISTMSAYSGRQDLITLSHKQANFEISFSSDCWQDPDKVTYAYRMKGLSDNWYYLPKGQRSVAFFDLNPGRYEFELKVANNDGIWGDKVISLHFRIAPSPFLSVWAYMLYLLLLSLCCFFIWMYISHKKEFKKELDQKQAELTELYSKKYVAGPSEIVVTSIEDELLKKALACIERNMDNSEYGVEDFVSDMAVGRTVLYQKINNITGQSIKEFILDIRLKRAVSLLAESDKTISEISYMTGFVNPKYFSTIFKKHFNKTPSEYRQEVRTK